jgi:hypothetical protein
MRLSTYNLNGNTSVFHSCLNCGCITIILSFNKLEYVVLCTEGACSIRIILWFEQYIHINNIMIVTVVMLKVTCCTGISLVCSSKLKY